MEIQWQRMLRAQISKTPARVKKRKWNGLQAKFPLITNITLIRCKRRRREGRSTRKEMSSVTGVRLLGCIEPLVVLSDTMFKDAEVCNFFLEPVFPVARRIIRDVLIDTEK